MKEKNPNGPIFIPKRSGLGWTINSKRPIGFLIVAGIIVIVVLAELLVSGAIKI